MEKCAGGNAHIDYPLEAVEKDGICGNLGHVAGHGRATATLDANICLRDGYSIFGAIAAEQSVSRRVFMRDATKSRC